MDAQAEKDTAPSAHTLSVSTESSPIQEKNTSSDHSKTLATQSPSAEVPAEQHAHHRSSVRNTIVIVAFGLCTFLSGLDASIVGNALPSIAKQLTATTSQYAWVGAAYNMSWASCLSLWARLSDIFGRKIILLFGCAVFLGSSAICAAAGDINVLILGRALQGWGAGAMLSMVNISIGAMFNPRERSVQYAINGIGTAFAVGIGPLLGGVFSQTGPDGWRWSFWINLPLAGLALVAVAIAFNPEKPQTGVRAGLRTIDIFGTLLVSGGIIMILLALQLGGDEDPWNSATVICLLVFGAFSIMLTVPYEYFIASHPLVPVRIFGSRTVTALMVISFMQGVVALGALYYAPLYFQEVLGAGPLLAGVWILAAALSMVAITMPAGILVKKTGKCRPVVQVSCAVMTLGVGLCISFPAYRSYARIVLFLIIIGLGLGPLFQVLNVAVQGSVSQEDIPATIVMLSAMRVLGQSVGLVVGETVFKNALISQGKSRHLPADQIVTILDSLAGRDGPEMTELGAQIATFALSRMWILYTAFAACALLASFFLEDLQLPESPEHQEPESENGGNQAQT